MAKPRRWTDEDSRTLQQLHADGLSMYAIAKKMNRSYQTLHKYGNELGLTWDTSTVTKTIDKNRETIRQRRARAAEIEMALLEAAQQQIIEGLHGNGWKTLQRGMGGAEDVEQLEFVPSRDLREHSAARAAMVATITKLDDHDPATEAGISLLQSLATQFGIKGNPDS